MGKQLISSGFITLLFVGWICYPSINQEEHSHRGATFLSTHHPGYLFQAELDVLNQTFDSFKVIKFSSYDFAAIFLSTLFSHGQVAKLIPQEFNEARKKLLLSCLYPAHEFS